MFRYCMKSVLSRGGAGVPIIKRNFWGFPRPTDFRMMLREVDRQVDSVEQRMKHFRNSPVFSLAPRALPVDAIETSGNTYRISIDAAGFKPEDIKVSIKDGVLRVDAKFEQKSEDGSRLYEEMSRVYTLPEHVDGNQLKSLLTTEGILTIEAPISDEAHKPKEIPIAHAEQKEKIAAK